MTNREFERNVLEATASNSMERTEFDDYLVEQSRISAKIFLFWVKNMLYWWSAKHLRANLPDSILPRLPIPLEVSVQHRPLPTMDP